MRFRPAYLLLTLALLGMAAGCGRVIPKDKLSHIYADMFIADQWVRDHPASRRTADTTFFYEPIFNSYGYTSEDYLRTVDKYLEDPEKYAKILEATKEILTAKAEEQDEIKRMQDWRTKIANIASRTHKRVFSLDSLSWLDSTYLWPAPKLDPAILDSIEIFAARADSVVFAAQEKDMRELDSLSRIHDLKIEKFRPMRHKKK